MTAASDKPETAVDDLGPVQGEIPTAEDMAGIEAPYRCLEGSEWWAIIARGSLAFRFGPYTGLEVGKIIERCVEEKIACLITGNCGKEFDWELARDLSRKSELVSAPAAPAEGGEA